MLIVLPMTIRTHCISIEYGVNINANAMFLSVLFYILNVSLRFKCLFYIKHTDRFQVRPCRVFN